MADHKPVIKLLPESFLEAASVLGAKSVTVVLEGREALLATGLPAAFIDILGLQQVQVYAPIRERHYRSVKLYAANASSFDGARIDEETDLDAVVEAMQGRLDEVRRFCVGDAAAGRTPYPWSPDQMIVAIRLLGHEPEPLKD